VADLAGDRRRPVRLSDAGCIDLRPLAHGDSRFFALSRRSRASEVGAVLQMHSYSVIVNGHSRRMAYICSGINYGNHYLGALFVVEGAGTGRAAHRAAGQALMASTNFLTWGFLIPGGDTPILDQIVTNQSHSE
jgi:hypothetical protein